MESGVHIDLPQGYLYWVSNQPGLDGSEVLDFFFSA